MLKSYEYRLYPNKEQIIMLAKHFGCNRFIYNWALAKRIEKYEKTGKTISKFELNKMITQLKKEEKTCWLQEVNAQSLQQSVQNMETAYINFFRSKKGFPKFKSKKYFAILSNGIKIENPKTGIDDYTIVSSIFIVVLACVYLYIRKKGYFRKI